jgi:hypothetical protein
VAWCEAHGLDPARLDELGLAGVLRRDVPPEVEGLPWPRIGGRAWWASGWRMLLGVVNASGRVVSVRGRWISPSGRSTGGPDVSGKDLRAGPGCYADPVGRWLLSRGPDARPGAVVPGTPWRWSGVVVIAEGGKDWLTMASLPRQPRTAAVLGVWSGSWSDGLARRLEAAGTGVVRVFTDRDEAGDNYWDKIEHSFNSDPRKKPVEVVRG